MSSCEISVLVYVLVISYKKNNLKDKQSYEYNIMPRCEITHIVKILVFS